MGQSLLIELAAAADPSDAGGKGAALATLARAGLPVPAAWVLRAGVLRDVLDRLELGRAAEEVEQLAGTGEGATGLARRLRSAILSTPLPDNLARAVEALLGEPRTGEPSVALAVRSSATCEGLPGASFAGQFQTFLDVRSPEEAGAAIRSCWASLWSASAMGYRANGPVGPPPGMAVVLQTFIPSLAAGAAHVDEAGVEVEAAWGLGPSVMSGLVVPDRFRFGPDGRLREATPGHKPVRASAHGGNLVWDSVPAERRTAPSLDAATAEEVAQLGLSAAAILGVPLELEWALDEDGRSVWLLQGRKSGCPPRPGSNPTEHVRDNVLRGIPVAPGVVVGRVRVIDRLDDLHDIGPGDIAVARYAAAAMVHRFRGAGLITEMGGSSAHASAIARERRFPMVAGVLGARRRLGDGHLVRLDGDAGLVETVEQADAHEPG